MRLCVETRAAEKWPKMRLPNVNGRDRRAPFFSSLVEPGKDEK